MLLSDFDFELPEELIAQAPVENRSESRMLVMDRASGVCQARMFTDIIEYLTPGDCLVVNDTRVIPARLFGQRAGSGGRVEMLLLEELGPGHWKAMLKPGRRMKPGARVFLEADRDHGFTVRERCDDGSFEVDFDTQDVFPILDKYGHIPLPPYIRREDAHEDRERYQTVYAQQPGAVAAPTAGLHFTPDVLERIKDKGVKIASVTLHVGPGTFQPVQAENIEEHRMHEESYCLTPETAEVINSTRARGGRVVAVGTTSVRVLETCANPHDRTVIPGRGRTHIFLHPPKRPVVTDALLTNFHLPKSTLIMLVSTFSSVDNVLNAYNQAVNERMRFYSYGDCMLVI